MAWIILCFAGLLEIGWAMGLKLSDGFTRLVPTVLTLALAVFSIYLVGLSARSIPVGTALCGLGRDRRGRHGDLRHRDLCRTCLAHADGLCRADRRGHRRAETGGRPRLSRAAHALRFSLRRNRQMSPRRIPPAFR